MTTTTTIQSLQVFDPAMCCSTGVCGPEVDPTLVRFAADLDWLRSQGVLVRRHSLTQNPAAFVENESVRDALTQRGESALPLLLLNGRVEITGRYPDRADLARLLRLKPAPENVPATSAGTCGCNGSC